MQIPPWPQAGEREAELLKVVLDSSQWGGFHPFVARFEQDFAAFQHSDFGIGACNGTVTIEAALTALNIGPGDEVIVPAISFIATASAVSRVGAIPVFVDIEQDTFNVDPDRVRRAVSPITRAVIAVHFGGAMCNIAAIQRVCLEHDLHLLEDAAHAQGSEWNGKRAGSFGAAGSFSFQNGKVLTAGEGGMLVTSDPALAEALRSIGNGGRVPGQGFYEHPNLGTNFRMTGFQAAVLLAQLERLPKQIANRTANARVLKEHISDLREISWQRQHPEATQNSFYLLVGRADSKATRDRICSHLLAADVPCAPFYPHTLYKNQLYQRQECRVTHCPVAEARVKDSFWLPHRVLLAEARVITEIADLLRKAVSEADSSPRSTEKHPTRPARGAVP